MTRPPPRSAPLPWALAAALLSACTGSATPPAKAPEPSAHTAPATAPGTPGAGRDRAPSPEEREAIARLEKITERVRHLTFAHPVPVEIHDQVRISSQLSAMIEEDDLAKAHVIYAALGLIDPNVDLRTLIERLTSEQVVGYYDPKAGRLVVRDDIMGNQSSSHLGGQGGDAETDEASAVLVHELTHALQDQRLGLGAKYDEDRDTDPDNAFDAVVEGDATLAMLAYVLERQGAPLDLVTKEPALLGRIIEETPLQGMELEAAPPIVRVTLVAPYLHGLVLCATLHGRGGWAAIDAAHAHPPASTEQVMHPAKYLSGEKPDAIALPPLPELEGAGLTPYEEDTLGELEMGVYLAQDRPDLDSDEKAAAGWGGDRLRVYRDGEGAASVVWFTTWDDADEAREAFTAAKGVKGALPEAERARYPVVRDGRAVLIVRNLAPALQGPVRKAFHRFARSL